MRGEIVRSLIQCSTQAIKSAVEAGLGISILPRLTVAREIEQGFLHEVKLQGIMMMRDLCLVKKKQRFMRTSISSFVEFITE
ncbi:LysR substrate-binding domain-containing protein [Sporosarcina obsidiansis]|uniref:LysR substrate-binding domain-containing protein n=1 Tax=Sporosarcina obsidiansis TaxID=2660748 RepID=UPI0038B52D18